MSSLKQRLASYEDNATSASRLREQQASARSLDHRKDVYQRSVSGGGPAAPSLKERLSAYQQGAASSAPQSQGDAPSSPPVKVKSRMAAYQPKKETLQDRMAKYQSVASSDAADEKKAVPPPKFTVKKKKQVDIKERMAAFTGDKSSTDLDRDANTHKVKPKLNGSTRGSPATKAFKTKKPAGSDLQQRMSAFVEASSPDAFQKVKVKKQPSRVGSEGLVAKNKARVEREIQRNKERAKREEEIHRIQMELKNEHAMQSAQRKNELEAQLRAAEAAIETLDIEEANEEEADAHPAKVEDESLAKEEDDKAEEVVEEKPSPPKRPAKQSSAIQDRLEKFKEVSSPDAFEKKKQKEEEGPPTSPSKLQDRLAKFKEISSPDAFQKKKVQEEPSSPILSSNSSSGGLKDKLEQFKAIAAPDAFQKKKVEEDEFANFLAFVDDSPSKASGGSGEILQRRVEHFKEVSSPDAFLRKKSGEETPPSLNPQDGEEVLEIVREKKAYMGKVVENKVYEHREGPKDYEYLYELGVKLEQLKQQVHAPQISNLVIDEGVGGVEQPNEEKDIKSTLESIVGGKASYTAKADWLNKEWIDEHLIKDDNYDSLKFQFRDHRLFTQFDSTKEKQRDAIISTMCDQLLQNANDISQLDLSSCLLPDKFLQVLAEKVQKNPTKSFPKLQLINLESNALQGPGIEAISEVIGNGSFPFLQAILMENQKFSLTAEAEMALADAVGRSPSVVVCSVSIKNPFYLKEINDAILYNMDQLRLARRDHQAKEGTLKERKRTEMELYFDGIAANESGVSEVKVVGDQKFLTLDSEEKTKSGAAFATNTSVRTVDMELLGLDDSFARAFGDAIAGNSTIEKVNIDSNAITGAGMRALFAGLGQNSTIVEFQARHQKKPMATLDEEALPDLLASNTTITKLGLDVRNQLVRMKLDRIVNGNKERLRKERLLRKNSKDSTKPKPTAEEPAADEKTVPKPRQLEQERLEKEKQKAEAERLEQERAAKEAAKREAEEAARLEEERMQQERQAAKEIARREADEAARIEAERLEQERRAAEEAARLEAEEVARLEAKRLEQERRAAEEAKRQEQERLAAEEAARLEVERQEKERIEAERLEQAELERLERERIQQERILEEQRQKEEEEASVMPAMDAQLVAPRELTSIETEELSELLKAQLNISSDGDSDDADDLLIYAWDMIESGESIGHVVEELQFMEMAVCGEEEAKKLGACLTKFFVELSSA